MSQLFRRLQSDKKSQEEASLKGTQTRCTTDEPDHAVETSSGMFFSGPLHNLTNPSNIHGGKNKFYYYPKISTSRQEHIEFNVQECIPTFSGRGEFIKKLHEYISNINTSNSSSILSKTIVICGLGGVGKTQVVQKYIQKYKAQYHHVLWINAESYTEASSNFLRLAKHIQTDVNQDKKQNMDQDTMEEVYDFVCKKFALLIYDNMESSSVADGKDNIFSMLPQAVKKSWQVPAIIITSRNRIWLNFKVEELPVFDLSESVSLLSSLEFTDCQNNRNLLHKVIKICQGLPLALQQVLAFVRNKQKVSAALHKEPYSLEDFLNDVAIQRKTFLQTKPKGVTYPDLLNLYDMAFEQIGSKKHGKLALQCLDVMSILNPDHISTELIQKTLNHAGDQLAKALHLLFKFTLITRCDGYYQMHPMIQAAINESKETGSKFTYMKANYCKTVDIVQEFVENLHTNYKNVHHTLDNVVRIHDLNNEISTKEFLKFQISLAKKLKDAGNYTLAMKICLKELNSSEQLYGTDHPNTLNAKHKLAEALHAQGKYDDAIKLYNDVIDKQNTILGPKHPNELTTKNNLAEVLQAQGKFDDAIKIHNKVLKIRNKVLGPEHPSTLTTKNDVAVVFQAQGKYDDAVKLYNDVLDIQNTILGPEHPNTLTTKNNLGEVLQAQGRHDEALELHKDVLENRNKVLGPEHPSTLMTKNDLAVVFQTQGKFDDAIKLYNDVLDIQNIILGPEHPNTLTTKNNFAGVLQAQGRYDEALELYKDVLKIRNRVLGLDHPSSLTTKNDLAIVFQAQRRYDEALELHKGVLEIRNTILGPDHPNTLTTKNDLAVVFQIQGKYDDAIKPYNDVLDIQNTILSPEHPNTLTTKNNLCEVFQDQGRYDEALERHNDVEIRCRELHTCNENMSKKIKLE